MTLLQRRDAERRAANERLRTETRRELRAALEELLPGQTVILFGSLTRPGGFGEASDADIALLQEPPNLSVYQLISLLGERLGRPVDVVLLSECRFRDKIQREGETWTL